MTRVGLGELQARLRAQLAGAAAGPAATALDQLFESGSPGIERAEPALRWAAYWGGHQAVRLPLLLSHELAAAAAGLWTRLLGGAGRPERPPRQVVQVLQREYRALLEADFESAQRGVYPRHLLRSAPLGRYALAAPEFVADLPRVAVRARKKKFRTVPPEAADYPAYYRRTFHWQSGGYLSHHSARIYDLSVEVLFLGCADVMRRRALAEVGQTLKQRASSCSGRQRLLDVGCGTGRFLEMATQAYPELETRGVDMSPHYASRARRVLKRSGARVDVANAERLPYATGSQDMVTSLFVLHELPRAARRQVMSEMLRVLRPGGTLVLLDAAQPDQSPTLAPVLERFPQALHEPFFRDYLKDDLRSLLASAGAQQIRGGRAFVSQVVTARAPAPGAGLPANG